MEEPEEKTSPYKLGIFYFDKDDKSLFVPKRFGMGWTFNFANVWSYVILILLIVVIFGIKYWALHFK